MFKSATGLEPDDFLTVFKFLKSGPHSGNAKFYMTVRQKREFKKYIQNVKPGMIAKFSATYQFFMYLSWLRNGFIKTLTSWLYHTSKSLVSRYLITWTNFLYFSLGSIVIWLNKNQVLETMPKTFNTTYPSTRCIKDCTKIYQKPSSLSSQRSLY